MQDSTTVTQLLIAVQDGDRTAVDRLFPLVYDELRQRAQAQRAGMIGHATMNTTAIVHEAYLKLADQKESRWESRAHFYAVAAKAMRHVFLDYAKRMQRQKRGAGAQHVPIDDLPLADAASIIDDEQAGQLIALNDALEKLAESSPRQAHVVECRFFGGMTVEDTAIVLDTSPATVKRDWVLARTVLFQSMQPGAEV